MRMLLLASTLVLACSPFPASTPPPASACDSDAGQNPAYCPSTWAGARDLCNQRLACAYPRQSCNYVGAGDLSGGCLATAAMICFQLDGGVGEWRCAQ